MLSDGVCRSSTCVCVLSSSPHSTYAKAHTPAERDARVVQVVLFSAERGEQTPSILTLKT
eukprot:2035920-Alexandrium_andersonii.AAC.1